MIKNLMVQKSASLLVIILLLIFPSASFSSDVEFPLAQSFSYFPYIKNEMLKNGAEYYTFDIGYSNTYMFNYDKDVVNDFDTATVTIGYRRSVLRNLNIELYLRAGVMYGGIMDKLIENFHSLIGNGEDGRNEFPRNTVNYKYKDVFTYNSSQILTGPFIAGILTRLFDGELIDINLRTSIGIPLQSKTGLSSGKPFLTTGVILLYRKNRLSFDMSLYGSFFKIPEWAEAENVRSRMFFFNLQGAYKKIFGGFLYRSTPFRKGDLSNPAYQIYLGYRINDHISISMYEEIPPMDTVTDVTFRLLFEF